MQDLVASEGEQDQQQRRIPLRLVLAGILGTIMIMLSSITLWLGFGTGIKNTEELLRDKADLFIEMVTSRLDQYLAPAIDLPPYIASKIADGTIDVDDKEALKTALSYAFAAAPQLSAAVYVDIDGWYLSVFKESDNRIGFEAQNWREDQAIATQMSMIGDLPRDKVFWGEPIYSSGAETTLIFVGYPVYLDDVIHGAVVATLRIEDLATFVSSLDDTLQGTAFILYDNDRLLSHPLLTNPIGLVFPEQPLPSIQELGDPVLMGFRSSGWEDRRLRAANQGHWSDVNQEDYIYLFEEVEEPRPKPWIVGAYFRDDVVANQIERLFWAMFVAIAAVVLAVFACLMIAKWMSKPAMNTAAVAAKVGRLELDQIEPLPPSIIKEPDEIGRAFNSMIRALRFFARYVPQALVQKLIAAGELPTSEERLMTVMFTDIRGFTSISSQLGPSETAAFLNQHFERLSAVIERHGGTIDKYMGDGVMAFWGAPEPMEDHAERAIRAALDIRTTIGEDNATQATPISMRIGIATGRIIIGDIGSTARMNYTVVGEAVNVAQRLEQLGKPLLPDAEVAILMDSPTADLVASAFQIDCLGHHSLRGLNKDVEVFATTGCR